MKPATEAAAAALLAAVREIEEPVERYREFRDLETHLLRAFRKEWAEVAVALHEGQSWAQVGEALGVTGSRAEQISRTAR